jgi:hypothetical protein
MRKKKNIDVESVFAPGLVEKKLLSLLGLKAGRYTGQGLNDGHQKFTGELVLTPVVNNFGVHIAYKAAGKDGTVYSEEHTLISLNNENKLSLWTLNSNFHTTITFDFKSHKRIPGEKDIIIFGYGDSEDNSMFREEIDIELFDNGTLGYNYYWGMPDGVFMKRSSVKMKKVQ